MSGIIQIDMHLRDQRVLEWIRQNAGDEPLQIAADEVSAQFLCHPNTSRAILQRLVGAGHIEVAHLSFRGGKIYKVKTDGTRICS